MVTSPCQTNENINVIVDPFLQGTSEESFHVNRSKKTNINDSTLSVSLMMIARVEDSIDGPL